MKKVFVIAGMALSVVLTSCGGDKASSNATVSAESTPSTKFGIDTSTSVLKWKGSKSEEDFHVGSVKFKSGSLTAQGTENITGEFVVDMASMKVEDEKMDQKERDGLKGHLSEAEFFNTGKFNEVKVKVNGYKDGKLSSVLTVLGKEMKQDIPVKLSNDGSKLTIVGTFDVDFKELGIEGLAVNEKKPDDTISSVINFDLNLVLNKQ
jgi:polyisoprenoid-binding protein YceI